VLEVLTVSEYLQNNEDNDLKPAHIKFFVIQKCSHKKQIAVITEEQICRSKKHVKEKQDLRVQPAVICFFLIKVIIDICRISYL